MLEVKINRNVGNLSEDSLYQFIEVLRKWRWNFLEDTVSKWDTCFDIVNE